jgi:hypothetical protein
MISLTLQNVVFHASFFRYYSAQVLCTGDSGKLENRVLAIIVNTQAGVEESW